MLRKECVWGKKIQPFTGMPRLLKSDHRVDRNKYHIQIPLPPKIDPSVTMMQVEDKPDITYSDVGGCKDQIEKLREVVETPLLSVRKGLRSIVLLSYWPNVAGAFRRLGHRSS